MNQTKTQTVGRHEVIRQLAREQVQHNVELIRNVMIKRGVGGSAGLPCRGYRQFWYTNLLTDKD